MKQTSDARDWPKKMPELRGPWLGQGEPVTEPVEFCPEILATERSVAGIAFSPAGDEAYFSLHTPDGASSDLMWMRMEDGVWTRPEPAPFNSDQIDNDIAMSADGERLCWRSWRPLPGNTEPETTVSLWAADRSGDGWGEPFPVECGGERQPAVYPGIAASGAIYFSRRTSPDGVSIVRAERSGKQYEAWEEILSDGKLTTDLCVAPDESFLVVTVFPGPPNSGQGDLHVSFRNPDATWSPLQGVGSAVTSELTEYCPTLSADGRRLFFCRIDREDRSVRAQAYWIDTRCVEALRRVA